VSELPAEAASAEVELAETATAEAGAAAAGQAEEGSAEEGSAEAPGTQHNDRKMLLWAVPAALASAALGSYLGYLVAPHFTHPSLVQDLEIVGMITGGTCFLVLLFLCVMALRPAAPAAEHKEAAEEDEEKGPEETPYDFRDDQRGRHRALIWVVPVTLALAAMGSFLFYLGYPGIYAAHQSPLDNLEIGSGGFLSLIALFFVGACVYAAWPARVYGPKRELPVWALVLKLIGFWLAMLPFSGFSLLATAVGIYQGVNGAWVKMIVLLIIGLVFGAACCFLLAGSGVLQGEKLKPGGGVSEGVRKSSWWRHFRRMLTLWALFVTVVAVALAIQREWGDCADATGTAFASWIARLKAAGGEMPEDAFSS
jgi:hypothetical protein